ncbi:MAG: sulfur carrier protein ThiS [Phycisphaerae bacterium]|nr:sulfur carrier protein ThiS [Phycisphaerae bacterium]
MQLTINGRAQTQPDGITVAELLAELKMNPQLLAVEVNKKLVTRSLHAETRLADGDQLEIVTLVGGG